MNENTRIAQPNCCSIYITDNQLSEQMTAILEDVSHYTLLEDKISSGERFIRQIIIVMEPEYAEELMTIVGSLIAYCDEFNKNITDIHKRKRPIITIGYRR